MIFFTFIVILTGLCWMASLVLLRKRSTGYLRHMMWFLGMSLATELTGYVVYFQLHQPNNYWVFNLFIPVELLFLSWLLYKINSPHWNCKPWILAGLAILLSLYFYESVQSRFGALSMKTKNYFAIYVILLCLTYYYYLLKGDAYVQLKYHAPFWVVTGCFFFYCGSVASDLFFDYLQKINKDAVRPVRYTIFIVLNFILYGSWAYSFLCKYRQTKLSTL